MEACKHEKWSLSLPTLPHRLIFHCGACNAESEHYINNLSDLFKETYAEQLKNLLCYKKPPVL